MLREFSITSFRNIVRAELDFAGGSAAILGRNAQGKTSLLEAICVLTRLQSPRTRRFREMIQHGGEVFRLEGACSGRLLAFGYSASQRSLKLDNTDVDRVADYLGVARVTWLAGDDLQMVRGNAEARRTFLDFSASQLFPGYLAALRRYQTALRQRNRLLKEPHPNRQALRAFNGPLSTHGRVVADARAAAVVRLAVHASAAFSMLSVHKENLSLRLTGADGAALEDLLARCEDRDLQTGTTTVGPHRDILELEIDGHHAGSHASEGQQRCVALALRIAHHRALSATCGRPPVVLVDDAFGELDEERRAALFSELQDAQCLIATTSERWLPPAAAAFPRYYAENGRFEKV